MLLRLRRLYNGIVTSKCCCYRVFANHTASAICQPNASQPPVRSVAAADDFVLHMDARFCEHV